MAIVGGRQAEIFRGWEDGSQPEEVDEMEEE